MPYKELALNWALSVAPDATEAEFLAALALKVESLWLENPEKLLHSLYRLDVCEEKLSQKLKTSARSTMFYEVAELIFARERAKAISRAKYSSTS